jgi:diguanylate cyclase (GGDEF)-like protein
MRKYKLKTKNFFIKSRSPNILLAEDDPHVAHLIQKKLSELGYIIEVVEDGIEVLKKFNSSSEKQYDLILLDIMMPGINGIELCRKIKKKTSLDNFIPIILISALHDKTSKIEGFKAGADEFLTKPFYLEELQVRVEGALKLKAYHDRLLFESITDGVTGIYNYRYLKRMLQREMKLAHRHSRPLAFIMLDLDDFKTANDTFGHPFGSFVLKQVALTIRNAIRSTDIAARYGGDEFGIILIETDIQGALLVASRILTHIQKGEFKVGVCYWEPSCSIGVAEYPHSLTPSLEIFLEAADKAMYVAKRAGKSRIASYEFKEDKFSLCK